MMPVYVIVEEAERAQAKYGDFTSTHEALGVLTEEFRELCDAVRSNKLGSIAHEAAQVAAVALRLSDICERAMSGEAAAFVKRSGANE